MNDNITENRKTINILHRMNVYQEVFLGLIYRSFGSLEVRKIYFTTCFMRDK